ncbi:type II toxin-antitoxin system prevent-host-death family antitoxin [Actinopolymorpha singaporensis]
MTSTYPIAEASGRIGELARRAAQHEHITLTDRGVPTAVLISAAELEERLGQVFALHACSRERGVSEGRMSG